MQRSDKKRCVKWLAAMLLLSPSACGNSELEKGKSININNHYYLSFDGPISINTVNSLISSPTAKEAKYLRINSAGGDIKAAIALGRYLRKHNIGVLVDGLCLSSCAHFIFATSVRKKVTTGSIVAFHGTATSRKNQFIAANRLDLARFYFSLAQMERDFYRETGISEKLLNSPLALVVPVCYMADYIDRRQSAQSIPSIVTRASFVVMSKESLEGLGVKNIAGTVTDRAQSLSIQVRDFLVKSKLSVIFFHAIEKSSERELQPINACG